MSTSHLYMSPRRSLEGPGARKYEYFHMSLPLPRLVADATAAAAALASRLLSARPRVYVMARTPEVRSYATVLACTESSIPSNFSVVMALARSVFSAPVASGFRAHAAQGRSRPQIRIGPLAVAVKKKVVSTTGSFYLNSDRFADMAR